MNGWWLHQVEVKPGGQRMRVAEDSVIVIDLGESFVSSQDQRRPHAFSSGYQSFASLSPKAPIPLPTNTLRYLPPLSCPFDPPAYNSADVTFPPCQSACPASISNKAGYSPFCRTYICA